MPFARDPRQVIVDRIAGDIDSGIAGFDAQLPLSPSNVIAIMHGAQMDGLYGYLARMALNIFPWSVFGAYADRYAAWNGIQRKPPVAAIGPASAATAGAADGTPIPQGLLAQRSDGAQFQIITGASLADGTATVTLEALMAGTGGNTPEAVQMTLLDPPAGVSPVLTVLVGTNDAGIAGGAPQEATAAMMARVQAYQAARPQGGSPADYIQWGDAQPDITRSWVLPNWTAAGTTGLMMVDDNANPITLSGGDQLTAIGAAIEKLRPVRGTTLYLTPTLYPMNPAISLVPSGNTALQTAVATALQDLVANEGQVAGARDPNSTAIFDGGFYLSDLNEAIKSTPGVVDFQITQIFGAAPLRRVVPAATGQLIQLGRPDWS
jgi:uncharacterized phage protein gp47/JayE